MSGRRLLNFVEATVRATYGDDAVDEWLWPPTPEERRAMRAQELSALGIPYEVA